MSKIELSGSWRRDASDVERREQDGGKNFDVLVDGGVRGSRHLVVAEHRCVRLPCTTGDHAVHVGLGLRPVHRHRLPRPDPQALARPYEVPAEPVPPP